jgi:hypothetical protein
MSPKNSPHLRYFAEFFVEQRPSLDSDQLPPRRWTWNSTTAQLQPRNPKTSALRTKLGFPWAIQIRGEIIHLLLEHGCAVVWPKRIWSAKLMRAAGWESCTRGSDVGGILGFCERAGVWGFRRAGVPEIQDEGEFSDVSNTRVSSPSYTLVFRVRATSHTSQEPWPWNCESPKQSVQRPS